MSPTNSGRSTRPALGWLLLAASLLITDVSAEIYKYTDQQGNVVYTDEPLKGAEKITLPPMSIYSAGSQPGLDNQSEPRKPRPQKNDTPTEALDAPDINVVQYTQLGITSPAHDSAIQSPTGEVLIEASSEPSLGPKHQYELLLDNQPSGRNRNGKFQLTNVERGTHTANVRIVSIDGSVVKDGGSSVFTVHRPIARKNNPAN